MLHCFTACRVLMRSLFVPLYLLFFPFLFLGFFWFCLWKIFRFSIYCRFSAIRLWCILEQSCFFCLDFIEIFGSVGSKCSSNLKKKVEHYFIYYFFLSFPSFLLKFQIHVTYIIWHCPTSCCSSIHYVCLFFSCVSFWIISIVMSSNVVIFIL